MSSIAIDVDMSVAYYDEDNVFLSDTGYCDRDGTKVYGGDLLEGKGNICKVVFSEGSWNIVNKNNCELFLHGNCKDFKKIGNIHTHPEVWED